MLDPQNEETIHLLAQHSPTVLESKSYMIQVLKKAGVTEEEMMDAAKNRTSEEEPRHFIDTVIELANDTKRSSSVMSHSRSEDSNILPSIARAQSVPPPDLPQKQRFRTMSSLSVYEKKNEIRRSPSPYFFTDLNEMKQELVNAKNLDTMFTEKLNMLRTAKIAKTRISKDKDSDDEDFVY
jgi:hypothetical protein